MPMWSLSRLLQIDRVRVMEVSGAGLCFTLRYWRNEYEYNLFVLSVLL
jgi:hypothetical protein